MRLELLSGLKTPCYVYDVALLRRTLDAVVASQPCGSVVHYALKANSNKHLLQIIADAGLGADCVSGGEIRLALAAGISADKIVYSGVGKTDDEIRLALSQSIGCFNVESVEELQVINDLAGASGAVARVALRVNPHIDAHTHHYITTGLSENKFGIDISVLDEAVALACSLSHVQLRGLHFHIGSQILTLEPYKLLCEKVNALQEKYAGQGVAMDYINVGGGLGVDYDNPDENPMPDFAAFFNLFKTHLHLQPGQSLHFELGRAIVCQCGSLLSRVLYIKQGLDRQFAILDAGMTELLRPALYQAVHKIENLSARGGEMCAYDVVGPVCESSDCFGTDVELPVTHRGDIIAIRSAGAYGESMSMQYNSRPLPGALFINE
ncbi:MAG: diaminopimelate decarboxylase [Bacteroidaceae bacterium]|nr:diaminopimelate decarboxylase [Bacteroidaceae bacterium]